MSLINLYSTDGQEIDMLSLGLTGLKLIIPSPSYRMITEVVDGQSGVIVLDRILDERNLLAEFFSQAINYEDSLDLRDKIYAVLGSGRTFYVAESKRPTKRWKVQLEGWTPERLTREVHSFDIPLIASSGSSESINMITKVFSSPTFRFDNVGGLLIEPLKHSETEIEFTGESLNLVIRNLTTGDEWSWTGSTIVGDTVLLKGGRSLKNNVSILGQTNKKVITITPGYNNFEVVGATGVFELTIRTRFYFL